MIICLLKEVINQKGDQLKKNVYLSITFWDRQTGKNKVGSKMKSP